MGVVYRAVGYNTSALLFYEKEWSQLFFGDVAASLSNGWRGLSRHQVLVSRKCERLFFSTSREASNLDVRSAGSGM